MKQKTLLTLVFVFYNVPKNSRSLQDFNGKSHLISEVTTDSIIDGLLEVKKTSPQPAVGSGNSSQDVAKHQNDFLDWDGLKRTMVGGKTSYNTRDEELRFKKPTHQNILNRSFLDNTNHFVQENTDPSEGESDINNDSILKKSPCEIKVNGSDTVVDCSNRGLENIFARMFPQNTTFLSLDNNLLTIIPSSTFSHLTSLQYLSLYNNRIRRIQPNSFAGLQNLSYLGLELNDLEYTLESFPENVFTPLENLEELRLLQLKTYDKCSYPDMFLVSLGKLRTLTINTVGDKLIFGKGCFNLSRLNSLTVTGNVLYIDDDSFENVASIQELYMYYLKNINNVSMNAFKPLINLDSLTLRYIEIGLNYTLSLLHPFVGRNMTKISLNEISLSVSQQDRTILSHDGSLTANNTKFLLGICVKNFNLNDSSVYVVETSAFENSALWDSCLENIDLSYNPLTGSFVAFFRILRLKKLITYTTTNVYKNCVNSDLFNFNRDDSSLRQISRVSVFPDMFISHDRKVVANAELSSSQDRRVLVKADISDVSLRDNKAITGNREGDNCNDTRHRTKTFTDSVQTLKDNINNVLGPVIYAYISKSLKELHCQRFIASSPLNFHLVIVNGDHLDLIDLSNSGFHEFTGVIKGLNNLRTLLLSGNDVSLISENFFDTFPTLETLAMASCKVDRHFIARQGKRLISKLVHLKRFDLSSNFLYILPKDLFSLSTNLKDLALAGNSFKEIPFDLKTTPNLIRLDMRYNSLTYLDVSITMELDNLVQRLGEFQLFLEGNVLSCGCETIGFLHWIRVTHVDFDCGGNFSCIDSAGDLSYTKYYSDLIELWRLCWGKFFLAVAAIILCFIVIGFLAVFLFIKNKTLILSILLKYIWGFELKKRSDYKTDVYIGYCDRDFQFPCFSLSVYLEDTLKLTTCFEHRDFPTPDKANAIMEAINSCWRVILVVNQRFLFEDEWALFTSGYAVYSQTPSNPARLVVIVEDSVNHVLPNDLLSVVSQENIFVVSQWTLGAELKAWLKLRLYF